MGDWLDNAKAIEELERERLIAAQLAKPRPTGPSRSHCEDCDNEIPAARQALGGKTRCVLCQTEHERSNHR
ncbi:TraR/DksA family transcriptional regulator [Pseudomonas frederiksbergensis]|uniref:TraR/DksA C4-type zinc finger protein n=1 Tax=Pseudomonas frederiksbergensis TaxID=104087 RepID=UPI001980D50F|nr:TraR/DksA C4-type zinc finger protein [Pseudomonas frederiksbergensis]MBN3864649.1 TraR/DksA family transcriptional regulator [Pseudomonas frederiksbergensis]